MRDPFVNFKARLETLLHQIMRETDAAKFDELGAEIWRVLEELDRARKDLRDRDRPAA